MTSLYLWVKNTQSNHQVEGDTNFTGLISGNFKLNSLIIDLEIHFVSQGHGRIGKT
ncbi:hypothetical protein F511_06260 [Dorcoceras hygrometricum]|uniref:Uncharacterized protein n=1 Tax=Dorcoceras hygrometricum TaxID=472368 RepID=A0A2Z7BA81_9LAMI|nr:hypothetical protein F511_06260 [Dorcoceras hygrometricum]